MVCGRVDVCSSGMRGSCSKCASAAEERSTTAASQCLRQSGRLRPAYTPASQALNSLDCKHVQRSMRLLATFNILNYFRRYQLSAPSWKAQVRQVPAIFLQQELVLGRELSLRAVSVSHDKHRSSKHTAVHMCTGAPIARNANQETDA